MARDFTWCWHVAPGPHTTWVTHCGGSTPWVSPPPPGLHQLHPCPLLHRLWGQCQWQMAFYLPPLPQCRQTAVPLPVTKQWVRQLPGPTGCMLISWQMSWSVHGKKPQIQIKYYSDSQPGDHGTPGCLETLIRCLRMPCSTRCANT